MIVYVERLALASFFISLFCLVLCLFAFLIIYIKFRG